MVLRSVTNKLCRVVVLSRGCTGAGHPRYAHRPTAERGYLNLAVFYGACTLDCLHCQNWHYKDLTAKLSPRISARSLATKADPPASFVSDGENCTLEGRNDVAKDVSCVCFFGGDPSSQMPHALEMCELALEKAEEQGRILRICWETNGRWKGKFALKAAEYSLESGGIVKFDLKTGGENLSRALCGLSNQPTLDNFKMVGERFFQERPELPVLTASTLLIPGYVDKKEVENLARSVAEIDPRIPYTLLAFSPHYIMSDLPTTTKKDAHECLDTASEHLEKVRLGNIGLLS